MPLYPVVSEGDDDSSNSSNQQMFPKSISTKPTPTAFVVSVDAERDTIYSWFAVANLRWADRVYFFVY